jgi:hypothetical protein
MRHATCKEWVCLESPGHDKKLKGNLLHTTIDHHAHHLGDHQGHNLLHPFLHTPPILQISLLADHDGSSSGIKKASQKFT